MPKADPHLAMCEIDLPAAPGADAESVAGVATQLVVEDIVKGRVTYTILVTFVGARAKLWQLHDLPAAQVDDVIRAIQHRDEAQALAVIRATAVPPEAQADRAYLVTAESGVGDAEEVHDVLVALKGGQAPGGEMVRLFARPRPGDSVRWLGHEPEGDVAIWFQGIVGSAPPDGDS